MVRSKIVAGNWKMNLTLSEAVALVNGILKNAPASEVKKLFFPPFIYISEVTSLIKGHSGFYAGAQNCSEYQSGAYTGEISAGMLKHLACDYVLVGHSERRNYFKETDTQLQQKITLALKNNLQIIYCVGETIHERKNNLQFDKVKKQIEKVLGAFNREEMTRIIIAYEPVWAIGTGETATPEQAQEMHEYIRVVLKEVFNETIAQTTPLLYGGSCNAQNAKELFSCKDIDGGLIGNASLKAEDFCKIIASF